MQSVLYFPRAHTARLIIALAPPRQCRAPNPQRLLRRAVSTTPRTWQQTTTPPSTTAKSTPAPTTTPTTAAPKPSTASRPTPSAPKQQSTPEIRSLSEGLSDPPPTTLSTGEQVDWTRSYHGLSSEAFTEAQSAILMAELSLDDIEIKPDGIIYLPEIKYRRILNKAFGPGGWGLAPRGETIVTGKVVTREYGLVAGGRLISVARGEQTYFDPDGIPTATEGCKSNALMRCCKDLGIASELWDPRFIRKFLKSHAKETIVEHQTTKKRRRHFMRKDDEIRYPFKEVAGSAAKK
ncbi:Mgm101p-domain-containing protein [Acrodontium crateriforme]|uniref:Mitochondrial genome maintenance protein MGM101 n=1 Tax=Acrodontium crateriforme TaxID=150365 RepID=A0AAQ3R385_9PEZI|nr:Mgm101p-domain-containing protein [Acrodontium crateriforme]